VSSSVWLRGRANSTIKRVLHSLQDFVPPAKGGESAGDSRSPAGEGRSKLQKVPRTALEGHFDQTDVARQL
jgi:hypothetical protein